MQNTQAGTPSPGGRRTWSEVWERSTARSRLDFLSLGKDKQKSGRRMFSIEKFKEDLGGGGAHDEDESEEDDKEEKLESGDLQALS